MTQFWERKLFTYPIINWQEEPITHSHQLCTQIDIIYLKKERVPGHNPFIDRSNITSESLYVFQFEGLDTWLMSLKG